MPYREGEKGVELAAISKTRQYRRPAGMIVAADRENHSVPSMWCRRSCRGGGTWFSPDGSRVYVPNSSSADVWVYDAQSREHLKAIPVGGSPGGVVFADDGSKAYVACGAEGAVYVIDTASLEVMGKVMVGSGPDGITYR